MTTDTQNLEALLRELVARFIAHPDEIKLAHQPALDGAVYWAMKGKREDEPKLVGKGGSHVDALAFLVQEIGRAARATYTFRLITQSQPCERAPEDQRDVIEYDARPARDLMCRILESVDLGQFAVEIGPGSGPRRSLTFVFTIRVKDPVDYDNLTRMRKLATSKDRESGAVTMNLVGAIGTLFRAIAKKDGVRFQVAAEDPR